MHLEEPGTWRLCCMLPHPGITGFGKCVLADSEPCTEESEHGVSIGFAHLTVGPDRFKDRACSGCLLCHEHEHEADHPGSRALARLAGLTNALDLGQLCNQSVIIHQSYFGIAELT